MPKWLVPWAVPMVLVVVVISAALARATGSPVFVILFALLIVAGLIRLRLLQLRANPPDPELTHKPFWKF